MPSEVLKLNLSNIDDPAEHELQIKLFSAAINPSYLLTIRGKYGKLPEKFPAIPGTEASGIVNKCSRAVSNFSEGDRITFIPGKMQEQGTWQQYININSEYVFKTPDFISDLDSGCMWINGLTAYVVLKKIFQLSSDEVILITAADSQLSKLMALFSEAIGALTIGINRRENPSLNQYDFLITITDDMVFNSQNLSQTLMSKIKSFTKKNIKYIFDTVGGPLASPLFNIISEDGIYIISGFLSGKPVKIFSNIIFKQFSVAGFWISKWLEMTPLNEIKETINEIISLYQENNFPSFADKYFDIENYQEAFKYLKEGNRKGKVSFRLNP